MLVDRAGSFETERAHIATGLHDGAVQELAGSAYAVAALARRGDLPSAATEVLVDVAQRLRRGVRSLRSVLVEIDPAVVHEEGLSTALGDLLVRVHGRGVETMLDVRVPPDVVVPARHAELFHRVALETVRHVQGDARTRSLQVALHGDEREWRLELRDAAEPGPLAEVRAGERRARLWSVASAVRQAGGSLVVEACPPCGTVVRAILPVELSAAG